MRNITFTPGAYSDYIAWLKTDKKLFIKITNLIREAAKNPGKGIGKPELLKHDYSGHWARRINKEHRLVYKATEETIKIISCKYHYEE
ncbi:MAG: Txe/YoeB family addiction module toxin [Bacteroidota bacterium]